MLFFTQGSISFFSLFNLEVLSKFPLEVVRQIPVKAPFMRTKPPRQGITAGQYNILNARHSLFCTDK